MGRSSGPELDCLCESGLPLLARRIIPIRDGIMILQELIREVGFPVILRKGAQLLTQRTAGRHGIAVLPASMPKSGEITRRVWKKALGNYPHFLW